MPTPSVSGTSGCNDIDDGNARVNQECTNQSDAAFLGRGQGQNETAIAVNPKNPRHLLAGQNDDRRGDGACGADWSCDGGRRWGSELAPLSFTAPGFTQGRHYSDERGDHLADQGWQWAAHNPKTGRVAVAYYDQGSDIYTRARSPGSSRPGRRESWNPRAALERRRPCRSLRQRASGW